jgi:hypothetical protein
MANSTVLKFNVHLSLPPSGSFIRPGAGSSSKSLGVANEIIAFDEF